MKGLKIWAVFLALCLLTVFAFYAGRKSAETGPLETIAVRVDTLVIRDTIRVQAPKETATRPAGEIAATLPVAADILGEQGHARDSVAVLVPLTSSVYSGPSWTAYVTGYHVALDSLIFVHTTEQITKTVAARPARFRWGAFASVEVSTIMPVARAGAVCAVPLSENGRWLMDIRGGYEVLNYDGWHHGPFLEAGVRLDF